VKCLSEDGPVPCSGEDGLIALVMAIGEEGREGGREGVIGGVFVCV